MKGVYTCVGIPFILPLRLAGTPSKVVAFVMKVQLHVHVYLPTPPLLAISWCAQF